MAAQKTLIQQLQESEAEARELQEFMQVRSVVTLLTLSVYLYPKTIQIRAEVYSQCNSNFLLGSVFLSIFLQVVFLT